MRWVAFLVAWFILTIAGPVEALETDQYWAWGRPLADSTAVVNARFNLELGIPVAQANLGFGLLYRVDSGDGRKWTVTGSVGRGF